MHRIARLIWVLIIGAVVIIALVAIDGFVENVEEHRIVRWQGVR